MRLYGLTFSTDKSPQENLEMVCSTYACMYMYMSYMYLPTTYKFIPGHCMGTIFRDFQEFSETGGSAMETSTRLRQFISTIYCAHVGNARFRAFT